MASATLLLPAGARLKGDLPKPLARAFGQADRLPLRDAGNRAQLMRQFELLPGGWPMAAITRQADVADAAPSAWLRADPAWVRAEMNGARLFACGDGLQPGHDDVDALLPDLQPLFGDAGFALDAPVPSRWYVRLPRHSPLPTFLEPEDALGTELSDYLIPVDDGDASVTRRWRALLNEVQVVLHNHPHNGRRVAAGQPPINSLWFWGAGVLPDRITTPYTAVQTTDDDLRALSTVAGSGPVDLPKHWSLLQGDQLIDLRHARDLESLSRDWLLPAIRAVSRRQLARLSLDLADGNRFEFKSPHRWRFWRQSVVRLDAPSSGARPQRSQA
ncbi:MAG: putative phosphotransferase [Xanthomonadaceae bacterium]|nr:putative phosphotransferase [Xanthomonadaceae bacterium]